MSTTNFGLAAVTPSVSNSTLSVASLSVTQVNTTSAAAAALAGLSAQRAPAERSCSALSRVRLCTVSGRPALRRRAAIGRPIAPVPMNAYVVDAILHLEKVEQPAVTAAYLYKPLRRLTRAGRLCMLRTELGELEM